MSRKQPILPGGVVTSDAVHGKRLFMSGSWLALCGLCAAGALGVVVWYGVQHKILFVKKASPTTIQTETMTPAQAIKAAQTALQSAQTPTQKATAYGQLGDAYTSAGQVNQSTTAYQEALVYSPGDIPLLERLSRAYEDSGDNVQAVATLQKLISAINTTNPSDKDWLLSRYQAELQYVQGAH